MKEKRLILKIRKVNNARKSLNFLVEKSSESSHEHAVKFCDLPNCDHLATFNCKSCNENLRKFCITKHYKNKDFKKDHDMIPLQYFKIIFIFLQILFAVSKSRF